MLVCESPITQVIKRNGNSEDFQPEKVYRCIERACVGLQDVSPEEVYEEAILQSYEGITTAELDKAAVLSARSKIEEDPNYNFVASRLLLNILYKEIFDKSVNLDEFDSLYREAFKKNIRTLVENQRLTPTLLEFDLDFLAKQIDPDKDFLFKYIGIQKLADKYLIRLNNRTMESPQAFFMRIAMGLSLREKDKEEVALRVYEKLSNFDYMHSTPTLFNSGTIRSQLCSCYLSTVPDSIDGIFGGIHQFARLSKWAGGLGIDWSNIRGTNAYINGTNGPSQGIIPWLKVLNDTMVAVNQGSKRNGKACAYIEPWHIDIEDFLALRKNTGDDRRRTHDLHTALWCPDLFFEQVEKDSFWYLFSPDEAPLLHETYGNEFREAYWDVVSRGEKGELRIFRKMNAKALWKKILTSLSETGHPWICFKDPCNIRYTDQHKGVVHSSNLCTEYIRHTIPSTYAEDGSIQEVGETAVCSLASINLVNHFSPNGELDEPKLNDTINVMVRALDNSIDNNFYPTEESRNSHLKNRPIGIGTMGFHDVLHIKQIPYDSDEAVDFAFNLQEKISYAAISASCLLSQERGFYPNFPGSDWSRGILPPQSFERLCEYRRTKNPYILNEKTKNRWGFLSHIVKSHGIRNAAILAQAPVATIGSICGASQSIEPDYSLLYSYETLSGVISLGVNPYFVQRAKELGLWSHALLQQIKLHGGDISSLNLPQNLKDEFKTAFQWDMRKLIDCAAARQFWIDMGQSFNLYYDGSSMKELSDLYFHCFQKNLKTTYYAHSKAASQIEKNTVCSLEEDCESCQ